MAKKLIKFITQEEFERLLRYTLKHKSDKRFDKNRKKYALAMILAFEAGLRISEVVGYADKVPALTKDKVDLVKNSIRIESGKGGKDRIVPKPKRVNAVALKLLPIKLSRRSLQDWVTKAGKEVLGKDISFHTLRHGFGTHLAENGVPLHQIQLLMGHSKLDTTAVYLHANPVEAIKKAMDVF